jgi:hypothetical protein
MRLMPLVGPTEGDFVSFVVRFGVLDNLGHSLALSRRLTGPGRPAKGSVVVTVTILTEIVGLVKVFTIKPRKIDENRESRGWLPRYLLVNALGHHRHHYHQNLEVPPSGSYTVGRGRRRPGTKGPATKGVWPDKG